MWIMLAAPAAAGQAVPSEADLRSVFRMFDQDRNGFVTADEQPRVTRITVNGPQRAEIRPSRSWIAQYDGDGDGRVSEREFVIRAAAEIASYASRDR